MLLFGDHLLLLHRSTNLSQAGLILSQLLVDLLYLLAWVYCKILTVMVKLYLILFQLITSRMEFSS